MKITFYGVRGSIPSPGPETAKYGGNTSCIYIELENGHDLILDAGTGIRKLGDRLIKTDKPINLLLSHGHWDHIQGYPFFAPIYQPERKIHVYTSAASEHWQLCSLFDQMDGAHFPIHSDGLPSSAECVIDNMEFALHSNDIQITRKAINHPGGGSAFRIEEDGVSFVYITDNELDPPYKVTTSYEGWVEFCRGADVLVHDAQYTEDDMPHKHGWGHSLVSQVRQLAMDAEVRCLAMFHHDPDRTDSEIDFIQKQNHAFFRGYQTPSTSVCAAEGMVITLTPQHNAEALINVD